MKEIIIKEIGDRIMYFEKEYVIIPYRIYDQLKRGFGLSQLELETIVEMFPRYRPYPSNHGDEYKKYITVNHDSLLLRLHFDFLGRYINYQECTLLIVSHVELGEKVDFHKTKKGFGLDFGYFEDLKRTLDGCKELE